MLIVFIIFGLIILVSFITGIVLTLHENKNMLLTDDPKILFEEEKKDIIPVEEFVKKDDTVEVGEQVNNINQEQFVLETPVLENVPENDAVNFNSKEGNKENELQPKFVCCNNDLEQEEII